MQWRCRRCIAAAASLRPVSVADRACRASDSTVVALQCASVQPWPLRQSRPCNSAVCLRAAGGSTLPFGAHLCVAAGAGVDPITVDPVATRRRPRRGGRCACQRHALRLLTNDAAGLQERSRAADRSCSWPPARAGVRALLHVRSHGPVGAAAARAARPRLREAHADPAARHRAAAVWEGHSRAAAKPRPLWLASYIRSICWRVPGRRSVRLRFGTNSCALVATPLVMLALEARVCRDGVAACKRGVHIVVGTPGRVTDMINRHRALSTWARSKFSSWTTPTSCSIVASRTKSTTGSSPCRPGASRVP